jgi:hypothetical protein
MNTEDMTNEEKEAIEVLKAISNKKLRQDFLFYGRALVKADLVKREEYLIDTKNNPQPAA